MLSVLDIPAIENSTGAGCGSGGCAAANGPVGVSPKGNLSAHIGLPSTGSFDPSPTLNYNSGTGVSGSLADNWRELYEQDLEQNPDGSVDIVKGNGAVHRYTYADGKYTPPAGVTNSLVNTAAAWVETQPDGMQLHYDKTTGFLTKVQNANDDVWTLTYDGLLMSENSR